MKKNITVVGDIMNRRLPKWPAMTVLGDDVTQRQAAEIIIRTDGFIPDFDYASNSRTLNERLSEIFGIPNHRDIHQKPVEERFDIMVPHWSALDRLRKRLKMLPLHYLHNYQIVSSYIGGPHGWCDWSGRVFTNTYNIGKWPSTEEVANEWSAVAKAFPFLTLDCQLYDKESCEYGRMPVVDFLVKNGRVKVCQASGQSLISQSLIFESPDIGKMAAAIATQTTMMRESGIPVHQLQEKVIDVYGRVPKYQISKKDLDDRRKKREQG